MAVFRSERVGVASLDVAHILAHLGVFLHGNRLVRNIRGLVHVVHLDGHGRRVGIAVLVGHYDSHRVLVLGLVIDGAIGLHGNSSRHGIHHEGIGRVVDAVGERVVVIHVARGNRTDKRTGRHILVYAEGRLVVVELGRFRSVVEVHRDSRGIREAILVGNHHMEREHGIRLVIQLAGFFYPDDVGIQFKRNIRLYNRISEDAELRRSVEVRSDDRTRGIALMGILVYREHGIFDRRRLVNVNHVDGNRRRILETDLVRHDNLHRVRSFGLVIKGTIGNYLHLARFRNNVERSRRIYNGIGQHISRIHIRRGNDTDTCFCRRVLFHRKRRSLVYEMRRFVHVVKRHSDESRIGKAILVGNNHMERELGIGFVVQLGRILDPDGRGIHHERHIRLDNLVSKDAERSCRIEVRRNDDTHGVTHLGIFVKRKHGFLNCRSFVHVRHADGHRDIVRKRIGKGSRGAHVAHVHRHRVGRLGLVIENCGLHHDLARRGINLEHVGSASHQAVHERIVVDIAHLEGTRSGSVHRSVFRNGKLASRSARSVVDRSEIHSHHGRARGGIHLILHLELERGGGSPVIVLLARVLEVANGIHRNELVCGNGVVLVLQRTLARERRDDDTRFGIALARRVREVSLLEGVLHIFGTRNARCSCHRRVVRINNLQREVTFKQVTREHRARKVKYLHVQKLFAFTESIDEHMQICLIRFGRHQIASCDFYITGIFSHSNISRTIRLCHTVIFVRIGPSSIAPFANRELRFCRLLEVGCTGSRKRRIQVEAVVEINRRICNSIKRYRNFRVVIVFGERSILEHFRVDVQYRRIKRHVTEVARHIVVKFQVIRKNLTSQLEVTAYLYQSSRHPGSLETSTYPVIPIDIILRIE